MESSGPGTVSHAPRGTELLASCDPAGRSGRRRWLLRAVCLFAAVLLSIEPARVLFGSNLHELVPGQIIRGAQPTANLLEELTARRGLRAVINLRGIGDGQDWYEKEAEACQRLGLSLENLTFAATRLPSTVELQRLLDILEHAPRPLFVHCRRGADRTGLVSAVVLLSETDMPYAEARRALGLRYGHWAFGAAGMLERFFEQYEGWLARHDVTHSASTFRRWARAHYGEELCRQKVVDARPLKSEPRVGEPIGYRMRFRNIGGNPWAFEAIGRKGIHLAYQIHHPASGGTAEGRGAFLLANVEPGQEIELTLVVPPVALPGRYRLRVDLLEEGHAWFHQLGGQPWEEELIVRE